MVKWILCLLSVLLLQEALLAEPQSGDSVLFRDGETLFSKGEVEKALWRFKKIVTDHPESPLLQEAKFRMGICYTQLKRPREAIRVLQELFSSFLPPPRMVQIFSLLGENYLELNDRLEALYWYGKALLVPGQPYEEWRGKVRAIVDTFDREEDLRRIESLYRGAYAGGYAKWRLAQMARRRGIDPLGKQWEKEWEKEYSQADYASPKKEHGEAISRPSKTKFTVGVLLPLSGLYQAYGERVLQGIELAFKESDSSGKAPLISLSVRDSKGDPSFAERAMEDLMSKERPIAILGPLLSIELLPVGRRAREWKVPIISFSQREALHNEGDFIFHNCLVPSDQVQTLLSFAVKSLGLKSFGVFYPSSPYGTHFRNLFHQEVSRLGGKLIGTVPYQEGQTDFSREIKAFFGVEPLKREDSSRKSWGRTFQSGVVLDGLFIPDTHDRVGLILSQMAYYDIEGVTFLGTNAWNGPDLISVARHAAEGAVFVDAFFSKNPSPDSRRFVETFRATYKRDPETLEALGYDGAKLVAEVLSRNPISSPLQMNEELFKVKSFRGVSGLRGFNEEGRPIRTFCVLRINKGLVEMVTP